jgi:hypothetical protein
MWFISHSITATGQVTELVEYLNEDGSRMSKPRFEFRASDGQVYTIESDTATSPPGFFRGEEVEVRYTSGKPQEARINTFVQLWFIPMVWGIIGIVWVVIGVIGTVLARRKRDKLAQKEEEKFRLVEGIPPTK